MLQPCMNQAAPESLHNLLSASFISCPCNHHGMESCWGSGLHGRCCGLSLNTQPKGKCLTQQLKGLLPSLAMVLPRPWELGVSEDRAEKLCSSFPIMGMWWLHPWSPCAGNVPWNMTSVHSCPWAGLTPNQRAGASQPLQVQMKTQGIISLVLITIHWHKPENGNRKHGRSAGWKHVAQKTWWRSNCKKGTRFYLLLFQPGKLQLTQCFTPKWVVLLVGGSETFIFLILVRCFCYEAVGEKS